MSSDFMGLTVLAAGAGIFVSLRTASVQEDYHRLSIGIMLMFMPLIIIVQFIPDEWTAHLKVTFPINGNK